jgi:hypothetical protein
MNDSNITPPDQIISVEPVNLMMCVISMRATWTEEEPTCGVLVSFNQSSRRRTCGAWFSSLADTATNRDEEPQIYSETLFNLNTNTTKEPLWIGDGFVIRSLHDSHKKEKVTGF